MVHRLRPFLLNRQIAMEARKIAHAAIKTCRPRPTEEMPEPEISGNDDQHTKNCNMLTRAIVDLALHVKIAGQQPPMAARQQVEGIDDDEHERTEATAEGK